ncbi:MAG: hypothetical protein ACR2LZ_08710 [Pyrinomonadaceae bacterium]
MQACKAGDRRGGAGERSADFFVGRIVVFMPELSLSPAHAGYRFIGGAFHRLTSVATILPPACAGSLMNFFDVAIA